MSAYPAPLDLKRVRVLPLAERQSLSSIEKLVVDPDVPPPPCDEHMEAMIQSCATQVAAARRRQAGVVLMYGAHLIKNGGMAIANCMMEGGWVTHLATNGAGTIHDWELSFLGRTEESVRNNVASGTFGSWDETGRTGAVLPLLWGWTA